MRKKRQPLSPVAIALLMVFVGASYLWGPGVAAWLWARSAAEIVCGVAWALIAVGGFVLFLSVMVSGDDGHNAI